MKVFERNSIINMIILSGSIYLAVTISLWFLLLWPAVLLVDDIFHYGFGMSIFSSEIRIQRAYQFINLFLNDQGGKGRDLEFGLYDGDLTKSISQAQIDKWEAMLSYLKLSKGDSLIDIGCGYGDWLGYAKSKGIHVMGINMSKDQAKMARSLHGIEVICTNWKNILEDSELQTKLYGNFDAVTFMGSVEHFAPCKYRKSKEAQEGVYIKMFELAFHLLKNSSPSSRVLISCLHDVKPDKTLVDYLRGYFFDKYYSGLYPVGDQGLTDSAKGFFKELERFDKTEDYRIASVLDTNHFAHYTIKLNLKRVLHSLLLFVLDPCHLHKWVEAKINSWMYMQFGKDAWDLSYGKECQKRQRMVTLWWLLLERSKERENVSVS